MNDEALLQELTLRDQFVTKRLASDNPELVAAGRRDEQELMEITEQMDEHPDGYEGRCMCRMCASYD